MKTISENDFTEDEWGEIIGAVSQRIRNQEEAKKGYSYYNADSDLIKSIDRRIINLKIIEKKLRNIRYG
jgi:hypothetical protein